MMEEEEEKRLAAEALKRKKEKAAMLGIELEILPAKAAKARKLSPYEILNRTVSTENR